MEEPQHTQNDVGNSNNRVEDSGDVVDNLVHTEAEEQEGEQSHQQTLHSEGLGNALWNEQMDFSKKIISYSDITISMSETYVVILRQHVSPEVGNHHDEIINGEQPVEGSTSKQVGNLQATS